MQVTGVFTGISSSPSPSPRQRPDRYAIRAGRNLPDKEFRYLRTVIVTAAVYRGFGSSLWPCGLTNHLNLPAPGRRQTLYIHLTCLQSPVFLLNSRYRHLSATQKRSGGEPLHVAGPPFFRSYGSRLQSSLTRVLSSALGFSPRPPESVCGTDTHGTPRAAFLGSMGSSSFESEDSPHHVSALTPRLWLLPPTESAYALEPVRPNNWLDLPFFVPARFNVFVSGAGILTCLPSPTPFGLGLGSD